MKTVFSSFVFFVCAFFFHFHSAFAEPKPLLSEKDGQLISDFFQVWSQNGSNVNLILADANLKNAIVVELLKKNPEWKISINDEKLLIIENEVLEKVISALKELTIDGSVEPDPFAVIAGLSGGQTANAEGPQGSSSIRVSNSRAMPFVIRKNELFSAKVVSILQKQFPYTQIQIKILDLPANQPDYVKALKKGEIITGNIVIPEGKNKEVLFEDQQTSHNLGAWYLKKGDAVHIQFSLKNENGNWDIEYIERK